MSASIDTKALRELAAKATPPGQWSTEALMWLLRFGRKNSGSWDESDGYCPDDSEAAFIVAACNAAIPMADALDAALAMAALAERVINAAREAEREAICAMSIVSAVAEYDRAMAGVNIPQDDR